MDTIVIFITASGEDEAAKIGHALVEARLAACVNIVRGMRSVYRWQGAVHDEAEVLMIVKTQKGLFEAVAKMVKELHSYSVPEIVALPLVEGSADYLKWLRESTG